MKACACLVLASVAFLLATPVGLAQPHGLDAAALNLERGFGSGDVDAIAWDVPAGPSQYGPVTLLVSNISRQTTDEQRSVGELRIREREAGDVTILDVEGKITDSGGAAALRKAIRGLLDEGKKNILLNLKGVSDVDDGGIAEIVDSYTTSTRENGELKLLNLPDTLRRMLMVTKFLQVFQVFDNEEDAVASFVSSR